MDLIKVFLGGLAYQRSGPWQIYTCIATIAAEGHHAEGLSNRAYALEVDVKLEHVRLEVICCGAY